MLIKYCLTHIRIFVSQDVERNLNHVCEIKLLHGEPRRIHDTYAEASVPARRATEGFAHIIYP